MSDELKRPGGGLANRPLYFYWIVDVSGSMYGDKIGTVNHAIRSVIPDMQEEAKGNVHARLLVRTIKFSSGASWIEPKSVDVSDFAWTDLKAGGLTDLGKALDLVSLELKIPPMPERALPPVLVLLSDGRPTDDYKVALDWMMHLPWGRKSIRVAISIGEDADDDVLTDFTGNRELVLQANTSRQLVNAIKWVSTVPASVSSPATQPEDEALVRGISVSSIPKAEDDAEVEVEGFAGDPDSDVW